MAKKYFAHSVDGSPPEQWHRLEDHLKEVLELPKHLQTASFLKISLIQKKGGESTT